MSHNHNLGGHLAGGRPAAPRVLFVALLGLVATGCGSDTSETTGITGPGSTDLPAWNPTTQLSPLRRLLPAGFFGYNANVLGRFEWDDERFQDVLSQLGPQHLRFPGGPVASFWDWQSGWLVDDGQALPAVLQEIMGNPVTLPTFGAGARSVGAEPIWTLNMVTSDLPTQMAMLNLARVSGLPVRLIELGSGFAEDDPAERPGAFSSRFPEGAAYADTASRWISSLSDHFPGSRKAFALDFTERPYIGTGAWPGLMGWMLDTRPSQSAIFLNLSGDKILLDVSGLLNAPRFTLEQISLSEPRLRVSREEVLNHFTGYGTHDLTLNPYSLTRVQ